MTIGIVLNGKNADDADVHDAESGKLTLQVFKIVGISAVSGFLFGFDTGIISGAMVFIKDHFDLSDIWQEVIISVTILGAWIFSIVAGQFSDKFGRRNVIIGSSIIFTFGSILMGFAPDKYTLLVGRLIIGAAIGLSSMVIPIYIAEIAPTKIRGSLVTTNNLFITGGQAVSALVAVAFSYLPEPVGWRFMLGVACIPSVIQLIGFFTMPESPRWLMRQDREDEARRVLQSLRGSEVSIENEFNRLRDQCGKERPASVAGVYTSPSRSILNTPSNSVGGSDNRSYIRSISANSAVSTTSEESAIIGDPGFCTILSDVMKDRYLRRALLVGCALQAFQQLTGINTVMYYAATIIQMSGVGNKNEAVWMASITAVVNFLTTFIGVYLVDRLGRRQLTLGSLAGVTISLIILSIGFKVEESYSALVGFSSNSPIDFKCSKFTTCNACVTSEHCGFCYDPSLITNGTCLQAGDDILLGSASELCMKESTNSTFTNASSTLSPDENLRRMDASNFIWSPNSCPAPYSYIILAGLCLYLLAFGPGMGPMPWTINSEIYPTWARTTCCSITTSMSWFFNLLISLTFLTLVKFLTKQGAFGLYASFGFVGLIFLYMRLPETKGKQLEETYEMFRRKSSRRRSRIKAEKKLNQHQEEEEQGDALLTDIILRASEKSAANNVTNGDESDTRRTVTFELDTQVNVMKDQLTTRQDKLSPRADGDSSDIPSVTQDATPSTTATAATSTTAITCLPSVRVDTV